MIDDIEARNPITTDGVGGIEYLRQGISVLIEQIDEVVADHPEWSRAYQVRIIDLCT